MLHKSQNSWRISKSKNYDSNLILQELGKFSLKIKVIPNGLKNICFSTNNKLNVIDSFQFLSS